jgi:alpha-L-rhamnosidase
MAAASMMIQSSDAEARRADTAAGPYSEVHTVAAKAEASASAPAARHGTLLAAVELLCDGKREPLAVESIHPLLHCELGAVLHASGVLQTRAQVIVSSSHALAATRHGDVWNSGERKQDRAAMHIEAAVLQPAAEYWWAVRTWEQDSAPSAWSEPARFATAVQAWQARWPSGLAQATGRPSG